MEWKRSVNYVVQRLSEDREWHDWHQVPLVNPNGSVACKEAAISAKELLERSFPNHEFRLIVRIAEEFPAPE